MENSSKHDEGPTRRIGSFGFHASSLQAVAVEQEKQRTISYARWQRTNAVRLESSQPEGRESSMTTTRRLRLHTPQATALASGMADLQRQLGLPSEFPLEVEQAAATAAANPRLPDEDRTDIEFVTAEGLSVSPEQRVKSLAEARSRIDAELPLAA